jgi:hypothetical protein
MHATFRPLRWDGPTTPAHARRSRATFKASWQSTLDLLDVELRHLSARDLVIEADFREQDIRIDGMPRANARQPLHPGVRIAFESKHGPLVYATDSCAFWQHNVRSIALGLESLRAVDRYGITRRAEQYQGYKAIGAGPTPMPAGSTKPTPHEAALTLVDLVYPNRPLSRDEIAYLVVTHPAEFRAISRSAARLAHPDTGGDRETWLRVASARAVLSEHHGGGR